MSLTLSTQNIASGAFVNPFTEIMAFDGSAYGPAVALRSLAGTLFDPQSLVPSTSSPSATPTITAGSYTAVV